MATTEKAASREATATAGEELESGRDQLTRAAFDFALHGVLSYLDHGEVRARCGPVNRNWSAAASSASRCEGSLGPDSAFAFDLVGLVTEGIFTDAEPGDFEMRDFPDEAAVFEPAVRVRRLWMSWDANPQFSAVVELDRDTAKGLGVDVDDLIEGQNLGGSTGLKLHEQFRDEEDDSDGDDDTEEGKTDAVGSTNVQATVIGVSKPGSSSDPCILELRFDLQGESLWELEGLVHDYDLTVVGTKHERLWELHQERPAREGVIASDGDVTACVIAALRDGIARLAARPDRDYHPGSGGVVCDHVHPGLFPFVRGESVFCPSTDLPTHQPLFLKECPLPRAGPRRDWEPPNEDEGNEDEEGPKAIKKDRWGRPYEDSVYQWLPTYFDVSSTGQVTIRGDVNNLRPRMAHESLYVALEGLFQTFLPDLAAVIAYADSIRFIDEDGPEDGDEMTRDESSKLAHLLVDDDLSGSSLQVITKIVDYELEPGQTHEGVWHVEGMSHEHIVATCLYVLDRDDCVTGGDLLFKRAFTQSERDSIFWNVPQCRDPVSERLFDEGLVPLGRLPTPAGRRLCWPNSHIHKVSAMRNEGDGPGKRSIVAFFVVDPRVRIVSTQEVGDQTESMGLDKALSHRLDLMEERKRHKQDWNVRDLNLCEH